MTDEIRNLLISIRDQAKSALSLLDNAPDTPEEPDRPIPDDPWPKPYFGGKHATWAVPLSLGMERHPKHSMLLSEFKGMCDGRININAFSWAIAVYMYDENTPTARLDIKHDNWCNMKDGMTVPWDPEWKHATDGDSYVTVINMQSGACYLIWQTRYDKSRNVMSCGTCNIVPAGIWPNTREPGNIWKKENGYFPAGASGKALPHALTTPEELESGRINHCMAVALPKPSRKSVPPAIKKIGRTGSDTMDRLGMGYRFAFDLSDADIDTWSNGFEGEMRRHAKTIGICARDYGFLMVDNGGNFNKKIGSVYFENDLTANWSSIGVTEDIQFAMHSLLKPNIDKLWFVEEPKFPNNDKSRVAVYDNVQYPDGYR